MDETPAVRQAECIECDNDEAFFNVISRDYEMATDEENVHVTRTVRCSECKSEGSITVNFDGLTVSGAVSLENASWNQDDEDEEESDDE